MKCIHNFDEPVNRIGSVCEKWDLEGEGGKLIPLGVADTDFKAPQPVIDTVMKKAEFGVYAYGALPQKRFSEAVVGWYKKRYGFSLNPETIFHSQGIMPGALWMLLLAFTEENDMVIIQEPVYHNMRIITENMKRQAISNDLININGKYIIDWDDLEEKAKNPKAKVLLLCNPHNPVGRVWTREELERMCDICKKNHLIIISDEIHGDIVYGEHKHIPIFTISEEISQYAITMSSPSKTFNLAGFYSAYVIIHNEIMKEAYKKVYHQFHFDYNFIGMEALITAYNECEYYVDQQNKYFEKNISLMKEFLGKVMPEVRMTEPEATYLLWLDFRAWNLSQSELIRLFSEWGVCLNDGSRYGKSGNGFLRVNIATQTKILEEALKRIKNGYERWRKKEKI